MADAIGDFIREQIIQGSFPRQIPASPLSAMGKQVVIDAGSFRTRPRAGRCAGITPIRCSRASGNSSRLVSTNDAIYVRLSLT